MGMTEGLAREEKLHAKLLKFAGTIKLPANCTNIIFCMTCTGMDDFGPVYLPYIPVRRSDTDYDVIQTGSIDGETWGYILPQNNPRSVHDKMLDDMFDNRTFDQTGTFEHMAWGPDKEYRVWTKYY